MSRTLLTCVLVLFSSRILSINATQPGENPEVAFSSQSLLNDPFTKLRYETMRNTRPSSRALQAVTLDGYLVVLSYDDSKCVEASFSSARKLNYCISVEAEGHYDLIMATAAGANVTEFSDSACTMGSKPRSYESLTTGCGSYDNIVDSKMSRKVFVSSESDEASTRPLFRQK